jgi:phage host-nuclease inhibitor protein Gam
LRDDPGTVEIGADLEVLTSRGERPTEAPRHPVFFRYKSLAWENGDLKSEITRLTRFYANEITHINDAYQAEIARLNDTYNAQINQLNQEIERIHGVYKAEIAELHAVYKAEIAELHAVYKAEIARLREVISEVRARLYWLIFIYRLYKRGAAGIGAFGQTLRKRAGSLPSIDSFWSPAWLLSAKRRSKLQPEDQDFEIR